MAAMTASGASSCTKVPRPYSGSISSVEALVKLGDLPVERGLASRVKPRLRVRREFIVRELAVGRSAQVGREDGSVDV